MEYKIGQRVKHDKWGIGFFDQVEVDTGRAHCRGLEKFSGFLAPIEELSPLYKPGDQVRVKSREVLQKTEPVEMHEDWLAMAGSVVTLRYLHVNVAEVNGGVHDIWEPEETSMCFREPQFDWYSGVEDKPESFCMTFAELRRQAGKILGIDWAEGYNPPVDFLPAEAHQDKRGLVPEWFRDKERDRAALAEVLKIKEPTTNKWMCPKCRFTGSIHDIRQHCVVAHGESLPPPESKSYWETWRVS